MDADLSLSRCILLSRVVLGQWSASGSTIVFSVSKPINQVFRQVQLLPGPWEGFCLVTAWVCGWLGLALA